MICGFSGLYVGYTRGYNLNPGAKTPSAKQLYEGESKERVQVALPEDEKDGNAQRNCCDKLPKESVHERPFLHGLLVLKAASFRTTSLKKKLCCVRSGILLADEIPDTALRCPLS